MAKKGLLDTQAAPCHEGWVKRKHGEIDYDLMGHGKYQQYAYRFKFDTSPGFTNCSRSAEENKKSR